ncbi:hypothetical protein [Streptomyces sp. NPDC020298]|uniref:hypothetical protein n=1 Tax=unclassified Streptomyces TaxID=2593676 RepID=UPI0033F32A19
MTPSTETDNSMAPDASEGHNGPTETRDPHGGPETPTGPGTAASGPYGGQEEASSPDALTAPEGAALIGKPEQLRKTPAVPDSTPAGHELTDEARAATHFANDAKTHTLTVHREDGVFRHIEFTGLSGLSRIILVTWPYNLIVAGSHGSFHFERFGPDTEDMLNWLRGQRVSPSSWASKLVNGRRSVEEYDRKRLEHQINERVAEAVRDGWAPAGLEAEVRDEILDSHWMDEEQNALRLVSEFQLGMRFRSECSCGEGDEHDSYSSAVCWNALTHHGSGPKHKVKVRQTGGFTFDDFTEWRIHKLGYHYLYQCHAAVWAIAQYDTARNRAEVSA